MTVPLSRLSCPVLLIQSSRDYKRGRQIVWAEVLAKILSAPTNCVVRDPEHTFLGPCGLLEDFLRLPCAN